MRVLGTFSTKNQADLMHGCEVGKSGFGTNLTTLTTHHSSDMHALELKLGRHVLLLILNTSQFRHVVGFVHSEVWQPVQVSCLCRGHRVPYAGHVWNTHNFELDTIILTPPHLWTHFPQLSGITQRNQSVHHSCKIHRTKCVQTWLHKIKVHK